MRQGGCGALVDGFSFRVVCPHCQSDERRRVVKRAVLSSRRIRFAPPARTIPLDHPAIRIRPGFGIGQTTRKEK